MGKVTAIARPNIALAKYWGKRDEKLNLPAVGSISITLDKFITKTSLEFLPKGHYFDEFYLNGVLASENEQKKINKFLDNFRRLSGEEVYLKIQTENNFPTSAGLASSASGFAALSKAADKIFQTNLNDNQLSGFARLGSGSAARSIFGGFVELHKGILNDGSDCFAEQIAISEHFPLSVVVVVTSSQAKKISSRDGMKISAETSPFYKSFVETSEDDIKTIKEAIIRQDFARLADVSMRSTLKMHSVMMTSNPSLFYWNPTTFKIIDLVRKLNAEKFPIFFTIDAGPQVKIVTLKGEEGGVQELLRKVNKIEQIFVNHLGNGAEIIEE